jgi:hypothetical protein
MPSITAMLVLIACWTPASCTKASTSPSTSRRAQMLMEVSGVTVVPVVLVDVAVVVVWALLVRVIVDVSEVPDCVV